MSGTIYQAAAGALLQQMRLDMLSNNLANVNTTGYKADQPVFRVNAVQPEAQKGLGPGRITSYAPPLSAGTDFTPGALAETGNDLDVAIVGQGFFEVQSPDGPRYTRNGSFAINDQGVLSTAEGWPVLGQNGPITIDGSRVEIGEQGDVYVDDESVGAIRLVDFPNTESLRKAGDAVFIAPEDVASQSLEDGQALMAQGFVETSNVNAIKTMTDVIETLRIFETYQRIIRHVDDTNAKAVSDVGKTV
ncbi:MAG: flagellar basal-body rod protein FlgF [Desulfatitalea sp.]|nr:flagellar basal-body rod protein FlgF [Desulfatitalea sp.]NNJ99565.1 flagellar basal-body rod protein FlgF [Desulfatitalea sp.]